MFYLTEVEDYIRVAPKLFGLPTAESIKEQLEETYSDYYDKELGRVAAIVGVLNIGEGIIIPGDGAAYYKTKFELLVWKPELHELVYGTIDEITNFGAFVNLGVMKGMIHISQTMDDYVSFSDAGSLSGKSTGRVLKAGDMCVARVVAISHKGDDPKIGLTMRQPGLGKIEWLKEDKVKKQKDAEKMAKVQEKTAKASKGGKK
ncbi:MAG: DNA-directed RNA polymerase [Nanoarchaeota archaeon]|nr:DNA-directed RNA polymerase [Nanoarchaeota archaeon]